jgi:hypothetical protein
MEEVEESGILCLAGLVITDVSKEHFASIFRVEEIRERGTVSGTVTVRIL